MVNVTILNKNEVVREIGGKFTACVVVEKYNENTEAVEAKTALVGNVTTGVAIQCFAALVARFIHSASRDSDTQRSALFSLFNVELLMNLRAIEKAEAGE